MSFIEHDKKLGINKRIVKDKHSGTPNNSSYKKPHLVSLAKELKNIDVFTKPDKGGKVLHVQGYYSNNNNAATPSYQRGLEPLTKNY